MARMGITMFGIGGVLLMVLGFVMTNGMIVVAGSILLGSALIANQISQKP